MDHSHYSKVFGLALAVAFGLMLALNALALSAAPKSDGSVRQPIEASSAPALMGAR
jgi:predicted outer membrane lipoprotein